MDPFILAGLLKSVEAQLVPLLGPVVNAGYVRLRAAGAVPDCTVVRSTEYYQQQKAVQGRGTQAYSTLIQDAGALIRMFHQFTPIGVGDNDLGPSPASWTWLHDRLSMHGVDCAIPSEAGAPPFATDWNTLVTNAASAAPLADAMRGWNRTRHLANESADFWVKEVNFHLNRGGFSRGGDRQILSYPYAHWSTMEAERLAWLGQVDEVTRIALYRAAGYSHVDDQTYAQWLAARIPNADFLYELARRQMWDDAAAANYGLDEAYNSSPLAVFFARAQGEGRMPGALPDQPDGSTDWLKLGMRAGTPLVNFGQAVLMQHRLRPAAGGGGASVVPGIPSWTAEDTKAMLRLAGYPQPLIGRMLGLTVEPLNIRIINQTLLETLKHPNVLADANAAFGPGVDWVMSAYLDHGFSPAVSKMAADAIRAKASDEYFAEKIALQKEIDKGARAIALADYEFGTATDVDTINRIVGEQCDENMAIALVSQAGAKAEQRLKATVLAAIHGAYMEGKLDAAATATQLATLGITAPRQASYLLEWGWERGDKARMLSTGEILSALKAGLLAPDVAAVRLVNLGWTQPDAMLEIAMVQHELDAAAARVATADAAKEIAAQQRATKEAAAAAAAKDKAKAAAAKAKSRADQLAARVPLEAAKAANEYAATALIDLDAYNTAKGKGETDKANAIIDKAVAAYEKLLLTQLALAQQSPGAANEIQPIEQVAIPPAGAGSGAGSPPTGAPPHPGPTTAPGGGTGSPPAAG